MRLKKLDSSPTEIPCEKSVDGGNGSPKDTNSLMEIDGNHATNTLVKQQLDNFFKDKNVMDTLGPDGIASAKIAIEEMRRSSNSDQDLKIVNEKMFQFLSSQHRLKMKELQMKDYENALWDSIKFETNPPLESKSEDQEIEDPSQNFNQKEFDDFLEKEKLQ